jgi:hypothetical protein
MGLRRGSVEVTAEDDRRARRDPRLDQTGELVGLLDPDGVVVRVQVDGARPRRPALEPGLDARGLPGLARQLVTGHQVEMVQDRHGSLGDDRVAEDVLLVEARLAVRLAQVVRRVLLDGDQGGEGTAAVTQGLEGLEELVVLGPAHLLKEQDVRVPFGHVLLDQVDAHLYRVPLGGCATGGVQVVVAPADVVAEEAQCRGGLR